MQVRAAREAGGADIGDGLALIHEAADVQAVAKTREMRVQGAVGGVVADDDALAVAALHADRQHAPAGGGAHRRAGGRAVVHALVRAPFLEHGVIAAGGEARGDARELHGRAQEGPAHAGAIGRVIGGVTVGVAEGDGAEGTPLVDELGREDGSVRYLLPLPEFFLVHDGEAVTAAQVEGEVNVPAEDFDQLHDEVIRQPGVLAVLEQRGFNGAGDMGNARFERAQFLGEIEAVLVTRQMKRLAGTGFVNQFLQRTIGAGTQAQCLSRQQVAQGACLGVGLDQPVNRSAVVAVAVEHIRERVAAAHRDLGPVLALGCRCGCFARGGRCRRMGRGRNYGFSQLNRLRWHRGNRRARRQRAVISRNDGRDGDRGQEYREPEEPHAPSRKAMAMGPAGATQHGGNFFDPWGRHGECILDRDLRVKS